MNKAFLRFDDLYRGKLPELRRNSIWVLPGGFFLLLGVVVLLAPKLVLAVIASFCLFVGAVLCYCGWKLMQFKARVEKVVRQFDGKILVQGINVQPNPGEDSPPEQKKIVFH